MVWLRCAAIFIVMLSWPAAVADTPSAGDADLFDRLDADGDGTLSRDEVPPDHASLFARLLRRGDKDGDGVLSRDEFIAALVPTRPEKPLEEKQPAALPQANAVRYLLLTLDRDQNGIIEAEEVPDRLRRVFDAMLERLDRNENGKLEPIELSRGGPRLAQIAGRYVTARGIDVAAELRKLEKSQGGAANRFDRQRPLVEMLADPEQARSLFARLDANDDGYLAPDEAPEPIRPQLDRFFRLADRDRDGRLSEREFLAGAQRLSRVLSQRSDDE